MGANVGYVCATSNPIMSVLRKYLILYAKCGEQKRSVSNRVCVWRAQMLSGCSRLDATLPSYSIVGFLPPSSLSSCHWQLPKGSFSPRVNSIFKTCKTVLPLICINIKKHPDDGKNSTCLWKFSFSFILSSKNIHPLKTEFSMILHAYGQHGYFLETRFLHTVSTPLGRHSGEYKRTKKTRGHP